MANIPADTTSARRKLRADYRPLIARAVAALRNDSETERAEIYARARQSLLGHLEALQPPLSGAEIAAELWALEEACELVESQRATPTTRVEPGPRPAAPAMRAARDAPSPTTTAAPAQAVSAPARVSRWTPVHWAGIVGLAVSIPLWLFLYWDRPDDPHPFPGAFLIPVGLWAVVTTILLMVAVATWYRRKRCRDAGLIKHRVRAFARRNVGADDRARIASGMSDRELFWSYFLPEHVPAAKDIVREELERRGHARPDIDTWTPAPADVAVPCAAARPMTRRQYQRLIKFRTGYFHFYRIFAAAWVLAIAGIIFTDWMNEGARAFHSIDFNALMMTITLPLFALVGLCSHLFRNRAMRILLLRPFGEKQMTAALKRYVRRNAGRTGNVFTLSDRDYKPSIWITILWRLPMEGIDLLILLFLGPYFGNTKRVASIKREGKFRKLERHLLRKYSPGFWSVMGGSQAFNIKTSDPWWQMCIHMLMHSCEMIVVDLSKVKEGTAWELNQLHSKGILDKCVFVVGESNANDVAPMLERYFPPGNWPAVHVYGNNGKLVDKPLHDTRIGEIMDVGLAAWGR